MHGSILSLAAKNSDAGTGLGPGGQRVLVDIDTGGTMTDVVVSGPRGLHSFKVETTPHDFTVCFRDALAFAATSLGYHSAAAFLVDVAQIRWSSTITTNVLAELKGSKVGLLVTRTFENSLYGREISPTIDRVVSRTNVIGLTSDASAQDLVTAVRALLQEGARRVCISYLGQYPENVEEQRAKRLIQAQYPDHFLGAVPILLGSEMAQTVDDTTRTHCSLINAYVHSELATSLFDAEDILRDEFGWTGPLLIGHTNGGVARLGKTKAIDTIESGPVFGTYGAAHFARRYKRAAVIALDVGGTTTKASAIRDGKPIYLGNGDLLGIPVRTRMPLLQSLAVGGGSVAKRHDSGKVELGPESMGSAPGPACYGLGGESATLTDALLCLGYLDPETFLGGRRLLDSSRATGILAEQLKYPGRVIESMAEEVRDEAVARMSELVANVASASGFAHEDLSLFAFGGNGPMFGALVCDRLGIGECWVFGLAPVFGAFGSAISRVVHVYERGIVSQPSDQRYQTVASNAVVSMVAQAAADLRAEGFELSKAVFEVECQVVDSQQNERTVAAGAIDPAGDAKEVERNIDAALRQFRDAGETTRIVTVVVTASYPLPAFELKPYKKRAGSQKAAPALSTRNLYLSGTWQTSSIFDWNRLAVGQMVQGPSLATADALTCLIPPGWCLEVDQYGNGRLTRIPRLH
jgi:N-methylhydantoinase A/oxoprolinase/acetone carboxylase beta subunit